MATKALTLVAQRASHDHVSARSASRRVRGWRELLTSQDASLIWHQLQIFVRSEYQDGKSDIDQLTQEVFLHLTSSGRLDLYVSEKYTEEEIRSDLLSLLKKRAF
jgi:hypothetical protein